MPGVNVPMLENQIKLAEAKVVVWEQKRACFNAKATKERLLIQTLIDSQFASTERLISDAPALQIPARQACAQYLQAHKSYADAELQIIDLTIAELKSSAAIHKAMLDEALGKVIVPGGSTRM